MTFWEKTVATILWMLIVIGALFASEMLIGCVATRYHPVTSRHWTACGDFCGFDEIETAWKKGLKMYCRCYDTRLTIFYKEDFE